ncbi:hypothetical protein BD626DRAFT_497274 [Schizophyllum amplum]|uniref:Uncharacterized protein n=1 Tax=Schizophyllum amplum TaxID=97359 RepID=A0A550CDY6_9AGAR|nr:hypothetical protein BD626DRAFT_515839 [Auriculariopsis ampla]TRM62999.1 hypothetical protein BD626DRAFT_497274 [Auriculariopsis ampla]
MTALLQVDADVLSSIVKSLAKREIMSLSSTCVPLRNALRPSAFASLMWKRGDPPPQSVWNFVRHLYVETDTEDLTTYDFFQDLSGLVSIHIRGEYISDNLMHILSTATRLQLLDMACFPWKMPGSYIQYDLLPGFPPLSCQPRFIKFCSRLEMIYYDNAQLSCASRMRALRYALATLIEDIGIDHIEALEVCVEALSLPFAVPYTWTSLRKLVLTGYWVHTSDDRDAYEDPLLGTPASISDSLHLGTLLLAAPRLQVLHIRWRVPYWLPNTKCIVWPVDEQPPLSGTAIPRLEILELCNPTATDGILAQLPPSLRSLALLTHPHATQKTSVANEYELWEVNPQYPHANATLTPVELMGVLSTSPLPALRELRLSFRGLKDMRLFEYIAASFQQLEVLEFHAETGPECIWTAKELADCAHFLAPLVHLRVLRMNTFRNIYPDDEWELAMQDDTDRDSFLRSPGLLPRMTASQILFGAHHAADQMLRDGQSEDEAGDTGGAEGDVRARFPSLREVWLPISTAVDPTTRYTWVSRIWQVYHVDRGRDGRGDLRLDSGPEILMLDEQTY